MSSREGSPELGDPATRTQYDKKTGRPKRRTAGQKKSVHGFVDSIVIEDEDEEPIQIPSEDDDGHMTKFPRVRKRKRSPSPTPPPHDPIIYNEDVDEATDDESGGLFRHTSPKASVVLQFNVPLGFHGPLMVKLDDSVLQAGHGSAHNMLPQRPKIKAAPCSQESAVPAKPTLSFTDLPPEVRNNIYRELFVASEDLRLHNPTNFCRSGQFLRTCKLLHSDGCSILYGENQFVFERNRHTRAPFWEPKPPEIGYRDVRQFLNMIGPENLAYLRDIKLVLEDAAPAATPDLTHEDRRYINDQFLKNVLRVLRQAKLRKFSVSFLGRRMLMKTDVNFLDVLSQVKADEVSVSNNLKWFQTNKIHPSCLLDLKESMTRKRKLYATT